MPWVGPLCLNTPPEGMKRLEKGPRWIHNSEWGYHIHPNPRLWLKPKGTYIIVQNVGDSIRTLYIGQGEIHRRIWNWEEPNLRFENLYHGGAIRFREFLTSGDSEQIGSEIIVPTIFAWYYVFSDNEQESSENHLMHLYEQRHGSRPQFNNNWNPSRRNDAPEDFILPPGLLESRLPDLA
jgi:hypothetical protein